MIAWIDYIFKASLTRPTGRFGGHPPRTPPLLQALGCAWLNVKRPLACACSRHPRERAGGRRGRGGRCVAVPAFSLPPRATC